MSLQGRKLRADDDLSFESWEAVEDVYEEMLDEEYELGKLKKAYAKTAADKLTIDTDERGGKISDGA